ncbi:EamA family transporter RarD [Microbacterium sp. LRZ72]|uniref:EamA family transporter RarD n=1 Tax=Microbacterium sp. LRZ72 TaxID=2942481 RepID=UPI0029A99C15|nr:EamA family transporter RarD [Microbacterium sp. LRZ72]MDX2377238.1 EamA family transporter RarD [Microbacterium sp. LRZ72]
MTHAPVPPASGSASGGSASPAPDAAREKALGGVYAFTAYLLWGFLPLYFLTLAPTGPWEIVAWRIVLSLVFCVVLLSVTRTWRSFGRIVRQPRLLGWTALAGVVIYVNWQVFLVATLTGHVIETSLGYFINPIITVLLGVLVLRESLRPTQWISIAITALAVGVIVVGYGAFPWIALTLACAFGVYGLIKKQIGPQVDAVSGLTLESFWLMPVAVGQLVAVSLTTGLTLGSAGLSHAVLLSLAGVATATPLLFFAAGARRVPLTVIGLLQFVAPILQFVTGAFLLGEPMPLERWIGFALVWVALTVLSVDSVLYSRRRRGPSDVGAIT